MMRVLAVLALPFVILGVLMSPACPLPVQAREQPMITVTTQLSAVATGTSTPIGIGTMPQCRSTVVYAVFGAGTSAGVVTVESAPDPSYAGTWASHGTLTWSAASKAEVLVINGIVGALRTRISTAIVGGTVTTYVICN